MLTFRKLILVLLLSTFQLLILAQQKTRIGIDLTSNYDDYTIIKPEVGLIFERQITNHSGLQVGFNYRTYQMEYLLLLDNNAYYPLISEKYLSVPISYKFYSKVVDAALGLSLDYNIGWKYSNLSGTLRSMFSYRPDYDYYAGIATKVSKQFYLGNDFILEPELKANLLVIPFDRFYIGIGIILMFEIQKD